MQHAEVRAAAVDPNAKDSRFEDAAPLTLGAHLPDRRKVSVRWLGAACLTALVSGVMFSGALEAAIGALEQDVASLDVGLAVANADEEPRARRLRGRGQKGDLIRPEPVEKTFRHAIDVSTVTREGDRNVVRKRPFYHVNTSLAAPAPEKLAAEIPAFDPLRIFSVDGEEDESRSASSIYGADVEGEITLRISELPLDERMVSPKEPDAGLIAAQVREYAMLDAKGYEKVASLSAYVSDASGANGDGAARIMDVAPMAVSLSPENVSFLQKSSSLVPGDHAREKIMTLAEGDTVDALVQMQGGDVFGALQIRDALSRDIGASPRPGQQLRLAFVADDVGGIHPVRASLYEGREHLSTVALSDTGRFVSAEEPFYNAAIQKASVEKHVPARLPSVYEGLYKSALAMQIPAPIVEALIKTTAFDLDFKAPVRLGDTLELVYNEGEEIGDEGEIVYARLVVGGAEHRLYRFRSPDDGVVAYYDEEGVSARKFLMRKPMSGGRFRSSFGMRRHPILGRYRMHNGTDWAARPGTPIMAAGNGVVVKAGWHSGYGRHIRLRHANGYETTYSHQSKIEGWVKPGTRVRQGQVIGYVGSSGLSTGPHLHYEVLVNGKYVDPMRIRLPRGRTLEGDVLEAFQRERERIDGLIARNQRVASTI